LRALMKSNHFQTHGDCPLVKRLPIRFAADEKWVVTRPFFPGGETRVRNVVNRVRELPERQAVNELAQVRTDFYSRHSDMDLVLKEHYGQAISLARDLGELSETKQLLVGAYFTMEYAFASTALFNPSIVPHPDQSGLDKNSLRFIMSLRATGEGHISSIVFRTGVIGSDHSIEFDPLSEHRNRMRLSPDRKYEKRLFRRKLHELVVDDNALDLVLKRLPESFTFVEMEHAIENVHHDNPEMHWLAETTENMHWLARENYQLQLPPEADISELVVFPQSDNEMMGIEDLRMVRFVENDGAVSYYGTYTAYNGLHALPQLMTTHDFHDLQMHTLNGACAINKGLALFPRRIGGHYCMCSRIDGENLFIMYSDIVEFWESAELLRVPKHPWEFMQIGNCGSPIETNEGWLLLTHGVGPMRGYCIGAMLLDLHDPLKVIGHLEEPLIVPTHAERDGYVPNVVYSCGAIVHLDGLYIPYAMSDTATGFAVVPLQKLLNRLVS
jgi:predicted GH43/DUF377 family glycosyl hydrolase